MTTSGTRWRARIAATVAATVGDLPNRAVHPSGHRPAARRHAPARRRVDLHKSATRSPVLISDNLSTKSPLTRLVISSDKVERPPRRHWARVAASGPASDALRRVWAWVHQPGLGAPIPGILSRFHTARIVSSPSTSMTARDLSSGETSSDRGWPRFRAISRVSFAVFTSQK